MLRASHQALDHSRDEGGGDGTPQAADSVPSASRGCSGSEKLCHVCRAVLSVCSCVKIMSRRLTCTHYCSFGIFWS